MRKKLVAFYLVAMLFSLSFVANSDHPPGSNVTFPKDQIERDLALIKRQAYYNFDILFLPEEIEAKPGENVSFNISIINRGSWTLREFRMSLSDFDYPYNVTPAANEIPVWGEWNPRDGLMRGRQDYQITINIPSNATGVHLVNATGKENFSWRKFTKSEVFILKVIPLVPVEPNITVSKITAPETIKEDMPFNINFSVKNMNPFTQQIDMTLNVPSDWFVVRNKTSVILASNESSTVNFTIVPTNTSGNISVYVTYPFKKQIFSLIREGPTLTPVVEKPKELPTPKKPSGLEGISELFKNWNLSPMLIAILVLIAVIVVWFVMKLLKFYSGRRSPEV